MTSSMLVLFRSFRDDVAVMRRRAWWRVLLLFSGVKLAAFAVIPALIWLALSHTTPGSPSGSIPNLLSSGFEALFLLQMADFGFGMTFGGPYGWAVMDVAFSRALMGAVEGRDERLAPAVIVTPTMPAAPGEEETSGVQRLGPLTHPARSLGLNAGVYIVGALGGVAMVCLGVALTVISLQVPPSFHPPISLATQLNRLFAPVTFMLLGIAFVVTALVAWLFARMEAEEFVALVDAEGVILRRGSRTGGGRRLRWSDARGFARILSIDQMGRVHEAFVVSGADADYMWEAMYAAPSASVEESWSGEAARIAAHRLVDEVTSHTGLPLLDLTPTIAATLATLATNTGASSAAAWSLLARARSIARAEGDSALERELARSQPQPNGLWLAPALRWGFRLGNVRRLTPAQRQECLRLARELLPYFSTPDPRRQLLTQAYWSSEFALQLLVIVFALASPVVFIAFAG